MARERELTDTPEPQATMPHWKGRLFPLVVVHVDIGDLGGCCANHLVDGFEAGLALVEGGCAEEVV